MKRWVIRLIFAALSAVVLSSAVYSLVHGFGKWAIPLYALGTLLSFRSAWRERAQHRMIDFWTSVGFGLLFLACAIGSLTGVFWPADIAVFPAAALSLVYLAFKSGKVTPGLLARFSCFRTFVLS